MGRTPPQSPHPEDGAPRGGVEITADAVAITFSMWVRLPAGRLRVVVTWYEARDVNDEEIVTLRLGR